MREMSATLKCCSHLDDFADENTRSRLLADDGQAEAAVFLLVELHLQNLVNFVVLPEKKGADFENSVKNFF